MSLPSNDHQHLFRTVHNNNRQERAEGEKICIWYTHMFVLVFDYDDGVRKTAGWHDDIFESNTYGNHNHQPHCYS